jgi:hypothetical protein
MITKSDGKVGPVWHYLRSDLDTIARRRSEPPADRRFTDADGEWLPQSEAATVIGSTTGAQLARWRAHRCEYLDGTIRAKQVTLYLHRSKHGRLAWVYHADDLRTIARKRKGWADEPDAGKAKQAIQDVRLVGHSVDPNNPLPFNVQVPRLRANGMSAAEFNKVKRQGGRPVESDPEADARLLADYAAARAAGASRKEFVRCRPGLTLTALKQAMDRDQKRRERAGDKPPVKPI